MPCYSWDLHYLYVWCLSTIIITTSVRTLKKQQREARNIGKKLGDLWASVCDGGPSTIRQCLIFHEKVSILAGARPFPPSVWNEDIAAALAIKNRRNFSRRVLLVYQWHFRGHVKVLLWKRGIFSCGSWRFHMISIKYGKYSTVCILLLVMVAAADVISNTRKSRINAMTQSTAPRRPNAGI